MRPWPVDDVDMDDAMQFLQNEGGQEPVRALEEGQFAKQVRADGLQAASGVARIVVEDRAAQPVCETRREVLQRAVLALQPLAHRDARSRPCRFESIDQLGNVDGIVLPVPVDRRDVFTAGAEDAGSQRQAFPGGFFVSDVPEREAAARLLFGHHPSCFVGRTVVDQNQFEVSAGKGDLDLVEQMRQVRRFVLGWNDN